MKSKSLPTLILITLLCHVLGACSAGSGAPSVAAESKPGTTQANRHEAEEGREVMVPDPETVMVPDQAEVMREDPPAATLVPSNIDISTCETLYIDASGNAEPFYRCFNSDYPVLSTKGICADTAGVKMDRCPNDSTPACRATADDAKVFSCEELGKQWCVSVDSNAFQACPTL